MSLVRPKKSPKFFRVAPLQSGCWQSAGSLGFPRTPLFITVLLGERPPPLTGRKSARYRGAKVWHGQKKEMSNGGIRFHFFWKHWRILRDEIIDPSSTEILLAIIWSCRDTTGRQGYSFTQHETIIVTSFDTGLLHSLFRYIDCNYLLPNKVRNTASNVDTFPTSSSNYTTLMTVFVSNSFSCCCSTKRVLLPYWHWPFTLACQITICCWTKLRNTASLSMNWKSNECSRMILISFQQ